MSELPHDSNPLSTYAYITFQLPPPSPTHLPNSANNSAMGPTRNAHRSTRRQQASPRGQTQPGSSSNHLPPNTLIPLGFVLADLIPTPGAAADVQRPVKKSHAKRQPAGHIPRPRNAFIIFRCDFVAAKLIPASVENNHRNISRIAGAVWKQLNAAQRFPWTTQAITEKKDHKARHPDYRYNPSPSADGSSPPATHDQDTPSQSSSQVDSPYGPYTISSSDLSASPAEDPDIHHLTIPGHRSVSAPPDAGVLNTELRMPQPSVFPLPVGFFPHPSFGVASSAPVSSALAPEYPGNPTPAYPYDHVSTMRDARQDVYEAASAVPPVYDWRYASTHDPDPRRYHEIMQEHPLYDKAVESERKPTIEELAAISYDREAAPQELMDPQSVYIPEYGYDAEPFLGSLEQYPYHDQPDVYHQPYVEEGWHNVTYPSYAAEVSGEAVDGSSVLYAAHPPVSFTVAGREPGQGLDPAFGTQTEGATSGRQGSWAPGMWASVAQ